jgi:polyhydroxybutyrate depolymerase
MQYSGFNALADEFGFAVCYPQGTNDSYGNAFFNVGYDFQFNENVDDVGFILALNDYLQANYALDETAVYGTGMSNGGDFCYLLACQASDVFQAVAPVAGMIMQDIMDACTPYSTTNILEIHGTEDDVTYYDGDPTNQDGWGAYPSIPETMDFFVDLFGLVSEGTEELPNTDATDGSEVEVTAWSNEAACPQLELYKVIGGGHDWPGAWGNMDIDASLVAWEFFESTCNTNLPLSIEPALPSAQSTVQGTWDMLGRPCPANAAGQLVIERLSNGQMRKVFRAVE